MAVTAAVALVVAGVAWAGARDEAPPPSAEVEGTSRVAFPQTVLGRGELPGRLTWMLEARRDGGVCTTFTISPGPPGRERSQPTGADRPIEGTSTIVIPIPEGTLYVSLGQVSDRTERVHIAADGGASWEVPTLGGGVGLGTRFFVMHTVANVPMVLTALAADGTELGRMSRPPLGQPR